MYDVAHALLLHPDWAVECPFQAGVHADPRPIGMFMIRDPPIDTYTVGRLGYVNMKTMSLCSYSTVLPVHQGNQIDDSQLSSTVSFFWHCLFPVNRARASCSSEILPSQPWLVPWPLVLLLVHHKVLVALVVRLHLRLLRLKTRQTLSLLRRLPSGRPPTRPQPLLPLLLQRRRPRRVVPSAMSKARPSTAMCPSGSRTPITPRLRLIVSMLTLHQVPKTPCANTSKPTLPILPSRAFFSTTSMPSLIPRNPTTSRQWRATTLA